MNLSSLVICLAVGLLLPSGYEQARWGITAQQLAQLSGVVKVEPGANYHFAEHMEIDPDVYVLTGQKGKRVEYYFFKSKLYKVFVIYDKVADTAGLYLKLKAGLEKQYGPSKKEFIQTVFGFQVKHTLWEDEKTIYDLRSGAGFIYQVRIFKPLLKQKEQAYERKKAI